MTMSRPEEHRAPENGDYHSAKRDLLRLAVERGELSVTEIRSALPPPYVSLAELELFYFALDALGVVLIDDTSEDVC